MATVSMTCRRHVDGRRPSLNSDNVPRLCVDFMKNGPRVLEVSNGQTDI